MKFILLLSGPIASGKSSVANELVASHGFSSVGTGRYLAGLCRENGAESTRLNLQNLGDDLDIETAFQWPISVASRAIEQNPKIDNWLLDSVRKPQQVTNFRGRFGAQVLHVHLYAPEDALKARYESRIKSDAAYLNSVPYAQAIDHPNEVATRGMCFLADLAFDTDALSSSQITPLIFNYMAGR